MKNVSPSAPRVASDVVTVPSDRLNAWVEQQFFEPQYERLPQLGDVFSEILWAANEYVPSESGSICLSGFPGVEGELVYVAAFGQRAERIAGAHLPISEGVTGKVFREGRAALLNDARDDTSFFAGMDEKNDYCTRSILAVPVLLEKEVIGVISLINRISKSGYRPRDLRLMKVFGGYVSTSLRNLIGAAFHREVAQRDELTGLRNDRFFHRKLREEIETCEARGTDLSLLFLDLDRFKEVVDAHGHLVGSRVIGEVGRLFGRLVDHPGATLARYGGDEYVVILPETDAATAAEIAEMLRVAILETTFLTESSAGCRTPLNLKGVFTASVGVASYRTCGLSSVGDPDTDVRIRQRDFIRAADEAMYRAKALGKNQVFVGRG